MEWQKRAHQNAGRRYPKSPLLSLRSSCCETSCDHHAANIVRSETWYHENSSPFLSRRANTRSNFCTNKNGLSNNLTLHRLRQKCYTLNADRDKLLFLMWQLTCIKFVGESFLFCFGRSHITQSCVEGGVAISAHRTKAITSIITHTFFLLAQKDRQLLPEI